MPQSHIGWQPAHHHHQRPARPYGNIWHAQMSFSSIGGLDLNSYECDLSLGKCTIPVGGLIVDFDGGPLVAAQPSDGRAGRLAGTIAGVTAHAVALGGRAWYARRKWLG